MIATNNSSNSTSVKNNQSLKPASPPPPDPEVTATQMALIFYGIGLLAIVVLVVFAANDSKHLLDWVDWNSGLAFAGILVTAVICNFFPFSVPPNLVLNIGMVLYFTAFLLFPPVPAALIPAISAILWELFGSKRGSAYAARTAGMYIFAATIARLVFQWLDPNEAFKGDITFEMLWPVLAAFLVFRFFNELIVNLTQYLQGYGALAFLDHVWSVTGLYLLFLPASLVLAMLATNNGPISLIIGCILITTVGYILRRATTTREREHQQLDLVRDLNARLANQNERQMRLGNRINNTLDSFLTIVREYAETSHEQEAAVIEITSTIEQLSRTASQIAGAADNVAGAAERAIEAADGGQQAVTATIEAMTEVRNKVREIALKIQDLNSKSERIGEIVTVINAIAGEIRLLALNATIEASGAGQFGRRFSIVANEVNQLADRSREALQQIKQIIAEIQTATTISRRVTEEGLQRMERSVEMASRSEIANREIIGVVQKTAQAAAAISLATQQQRSASEQVVTSVHDVAIMIGQNAEKVASVSVASTDLQRVARELRAEDQN